MCPACIAAAALIGSKATAAAGLTAVVVKIFRTKRNEFDNPKQRNQDESSKNRIAG